MAISSCPYMALNELNIVSTSNLIIAEECKKTKVIDVGIKTLSEALIKK